MKVPCRKIQAAALVVAVSSLTGWQPAAAQDTDTMETVVVTATQTETPISRLGQSVTVIDREQIRNTRLTNLSDLLRQVVGIDFRSNGPNASTANLGIRGLSGYHTKMLVNGIPLQDTASVQQMPVFNDINLADVERIEVVRGPSSTVHGSNALGGVVNIITRRGESERPSIRLGFETGSHARFRNSAAVSGIQGPMDYSISVLRESERGISVQNTPLNRDNDHWRQHQVQGRIGMQLDENLRLEWFGRFSESDEEYDMADAVWGPFNDSGDVENRRWMTGLTLAATGWLDGVWDTSLTASVSELSRKYRDKAGFSLNDRFVGRSLEATWLNTLHLHERVDLVLGLSESSEEAKVEDGGVPAWGIPPSTPVDDRHRTTAAYAQLLLEPIDNLYLNGGVRWNNHSLFGYEWTYSAAAAYHVEQTGTRFKTSVGKSYRAASLYELYEPTYGDPTLQPEIGTSWDIGFEQDLWADRVTLGSTYFRNRITDYIGFDLATFTYGQVSGIKTNGLESFVRVTPVETVAITLTHTYQHTNDMQMEVSPLAFRPRHKGSANLDWHLCADRVTLNLNGLYVGHQNSLNGGGEHLDAYVLANTAVTYRLAEWVDLYARIENLLNTNYEIIPDYNTYGRVYYVGVNMQF